MVLVRELSPSTLGRWISLKAFSEESREKSSRNAHTLCQQDLFGRTSFQKFQGLGPWPRCKSHVDCPGPVFYVHFFFWPLASCSSKSLFGPHLCVFTCKLLEWLFYLHFHLLDTKGIFWSHFKQTPFSWCLVRPSLGGVCLLKNFFFFLLGNVHVLWASNTASLNNFYAACKHTTLFSAFSV